MFYDMFINLCNQNGVSPSAVLTQLGMNRSTATFWKQGKSLPSQETVNKIADYFGVTLDYLMGRDKLQKEKPATISGDELDDEIIRLINSLRGDRQKNAIDYLRFLAQEQESEANK